MKTMSTTKARLVLGKLVESVHAGDLSVVLGKRNTPQAILIKYPDTFSKEASEIANINAYSKSFDFLKSEPDIYSHKDIKK